MPALANRWRPGRRISLVGLLLAALSPLLLVTHAGATSPPWTSGTVFIADQGSAGGGALWALPPGGSPTFLESGTVEGVATDAAGDLFWTDCNGPVYELPVGGSLTLLTTASSCPTGIAVDTSGDVFFGAFSGPGGGAAGLYEIPSGGSPVLVTSSVGEFSSIAIDGNGDIWGASAGANLVLVPHGTSTAVVVTVPTYGYINGVGLDNSNDVFVSAGPYDVAAKLPVGGGASVPYGSGLSYADGVAVDGGGDVFIGQPSTSPGLGSVDEVVGGTTSVVASGITYVTGLAIWPPMAPAARTTSSTTLTSSRPSPVTTETNVTFTATVSPAGGLGAVQFSDGVRPFGNPVATNAAGVAHLPTMLSQGTHQITATYLGDASNAPSISNALPFTATPIKTKTVLTTPGGTTVPGDQPVSVTATVTGKGGPPTGDVEFMVNGSVVASAALDTTGHATQSVPLPPGTSKVKALYQGDPTFATSSSNTIIFTTTPPYTPTVTSTVSYGQPKPNGSEKATIHVKVTGVKGNGAPTGTVSANDGFTCTVLTAGTLASTATCTHVVPNNTSEDVLISYSGDSTYDAASRFQSVSVGGG